MNCDAAELPQASYRPNIADEIDSPEDRFLELIAVQAVQLPHGFSRQWFNQCVAAVAIEALRNAAAEGTLGELFSDVEPTKSDMELVSRLLAELIDADNPRLQAKCFAFVLGLTSKSQVQIGREEKVGKAAVSKRCIRITETLGLPPGRGMKSMKARESYRRRQLGKRARPQREAWGWAGLLEGVFQNANLAIA